MPEENCLAARLFLPKHKDAPVPRLRQPSTTTNRFTILLPPLRPLRPHSTICYLRDVFDEDAFEVVQFFGSKVRVLKTDGGASAGVDQAADALKISQLLSRGVADLIRKDYLDKLVLAISDRRTGELVEQYLFQYKASALGVTYKSNDGKKKKKEQLKVECGKLSQADTKKSFKSVTRGLVAITETLDELPKEARCQIFVTYKSSAPQDYEPPFFSEFRGQAGELQFDAGTAVSMSLGKVKTRFHEVSMRMRIREDKLPDEEDEEDEEDEKDEKMQPRDSTSSKKFDQDGASSSFIVPCSVPVSQISKNDNKRSLPGPPRLNRHPRKNISSKKRRSAFSPEQVRESKRPVKSAYDSGKSDSDDDFTDTDDRRRRSKSSRCQ